MVLEIFIDDRHPCRLTSPEALGLRHFALTVNNIEEFCLDKESIKLDWFERRFAFVKDLDGLPIELIERVEE